MATRGGAVWRGLWLTAALWLAAIVAQAQDLAPIPKMDSPVVDTTGTLDAGARQQLEAQALALQQRKGSQLQVLLVPTTQPEDIAQYAVRAFEQWKLGRKGVDDGVLLVVAKQDRRVRIEVGYGLEGAIPDATASRVIQEYLVPHFRNGDYAGGIVEASAALTKLIDGEPLPAPMADNRADSGGGGGGESILISLFVALVVAQVARAVFNGAPRPLRALLGAGAAGGAAWLLSSFLLVGGLGAVIGFVTGLLSASRSGRFARDAGYGGWGGGGGDWGGGGGFGGGGGGGWSGGGGSSGGGGASGSW
ncbi:TPM domain-containing protein [Lysobacter silvisoli]|uniref:YgcG family protein n=1 Tax=Lysobacter silvisoli TaxID=2293254 RepID=A0A371JZ65_9GAMM|nr:TPM domain-containing protein [Lysobacter silvisoli]RDZ26912.1 YgcG family protein [Lysobacter silvisoli]